MTSSLEPIISHRYHTLKQWSVENIGNICDVAAYGVREPENSILRVLNLVYRSISYSFQVSRCSYFMSRHCNGRKVVQVNGRSFENAPEARSHILRISAESIGIIGASDRCDRYWLKNPTSVMLYSPYSELVVIVIVTDLLKWPCKVYMP